MSCLHRFRVAIVALFITALPLGALALPPGFVDELVLSGFTDVVGVTFDANDRMYVWERRGVVHVVENGQVLTPALIDISEEVGGWRDFGLLGFALDHDFLTNGHMYLYYVVDRHHLLHFGTPLYNPATNEYFNATIGRITRYTAEASTGFTTTDLGSRTILLGESASTGVPILHQSHGTGALAFGADGSLLASAGDAASYTAIDAGNLGVTYYAQALADGIIRPEENVGAFRSQMLDSHNGKMMRLDPATGDGLASNPFFDPANPRSARSRTFALGLRNPFRFIVRPGTGNADPSAADPGSIYVGDVEWGTWEDIHILNEPGMNAGWPLFEGLTEHGGYQVTMTENQDAPNPLFGQNGCTIEFFRFQDLLAQEQKDHNPSFPNPCDPNQQISPAAPTFMHHRPLLDYRHGADIARAPIFNGNIAAVATIGSAESPIAGTPFRGRASAAGAWHSGLGFPAPYGGAYFHLDFAEGWVRAIIMDEDDHAEEVLDFGTIAAPVAMAEDPTDGSLLYVSFSAKQVRRIRYNGSVNLPPVPRPTADVEFGAGPLTVQFDGSESADPENSDVTFAWTFSDGATSTHPSPIHTFASNGGVPTAYDATLTVTDDLGASDSETIQVWTDNTPPSVEITSFVNGSLYSTAQSSTLPLAASVSDFEHPIGSLAFSWQVSLRHGTHSHPEPPDTSQTTSAAISPTPCDTEFYGYLVELTVTDPEGLSGRDEAWVLPDCSGASVTGAITAPVETDEFAVHETTTLTASAAGDVARVEFFVNGERIGIDFTAPYEAAWTASDAGVALISALVVANDGTGASTEGVPVLVRTPQKYSERIDHSNDDGEERADGSIRRKNRDLEMVEDGSALQTVAVRFEPDLPQGAFISSAYIRFTADEIDTGQTDLVIRAEANDDAAQLAYVDFDITNRTPGNASVVWSPSAWRYKHATGALQTTPNLGPLVQEVVNRPGWQPQNGMMFLVEGAGERTAEAFDGSAAEAAVLVVDYDTGATPNLAPTVSAGPDVTMTLGQQATLLGSASDDGLPNGTLDVLWSKISGPGNVTFANPTSASTVATIDTVGVYTLRLTADDSELTQTDDVIVTVNSNTALTFETQVSDAKDDAEEHLDDNSVWRNSPDLEMTQDGSTSQLIGIRLSLDIPQGATINEAHVQFTADETDSVATDLVIRAEAADDAVRIVRQTANLSSRLLTTASVTWQPPAWLVVGESASAERTPNIASILQEVVSRPGWTAGNHVLLLISGTGQRTAESFNGSSSDAPSIYIEYLP